jgi:transcriptional regulator with XRE-family HTH domain
VNERIKKLRKALDLTQQEFADRLGVKRNTVGQWECGINNVTDATIVFLCKEFNVNEEWLRNGTGEMFLPVDRNADIARLTKQLLDEESDSFKNRLISILSNLSVEEWQYLEKRAKELCGIDDLHNSK